MNYKVFYYPYKTDAMNQNSERQQALAIALLEDSHQISADPSNPPQEELVLDDELEGLRIL